MQNITSSTSFLAPPPYRQIRARYDSETVRVYQAYRPEIADAAVAAGRFVPPFSLDRMTWIKPSFLWMMYRCGWATKPGQERVLAVDITREGFEWALSHSCLSHYEPNTYATEEEWSALKTESPVRIHWDPERSAALDRLGWRSIQIGVGGDAVPRYASEWVTNITDISSTVHRIAASENMTRTSLLNEILAHERPYPLSSAIAARIGATPKDSS